MWAAGSSCCNWGAYWQQQGAKKKKAAIWQFAKNRWGCVDGWETGVWVDFWANHSEATEAAYQSGAKWYQFKVQDHDVITVVFDRGYDGEGHHQYSANQGIYRSVRRVKIL